MLAALAGTRQVRHVMGMPVLVDLRDEEIGEDGLDEAFGWLRFVDDTFSTYKHSSEIARLERGELLVEEASKCVREVLDRCDELRLETRGYFDVAVVGGDPSGLVKGWAVDRAAAILHAAGHRNYAVNAGGDIRLRGRPLPEPAWRVGIQHPLQRDQVAAVVESNDLAIATSGEYACGRHILDPHTSAPPSAVLSVTVVGPDLATADAYATAAFAMGTRGPSWTARLHGYDAMTILADGRVLSTPGFPAAASLAFPVCIRR